MYIMIFIIFKVLFEFLKNFLTNGSNKATDGQAQTNYIFMHPTIVLGWPVPI